MAGITEQKPSLSFVVPAYNVQRYLARCLNSLVFQTRQDIEILVVDDGSTDTTRSIAERYRRSFPEKITVLATPNGGPARARRLGLNHASAPFVSFVDADDWVHPSMAELFLREIERGSDFVYATHATVREGDTAIAGKCVVKEPTVSGIIRQGNTSYCGKAWKRDFLLERAEFPEILHEDVAEVPALISWVQSPSVIRTPLYYYFKGNSASRTTKRSDGDRKDLFEADLLCWKKMNPSHLDDFRAKLAVRLTMNLDFTEVYDLSVGYARWAYDRFGLERIMGDISEARRNKLASLLEKNVEKVPERLVLEDPPRSHPSDGLADFEGTAFREEPDVVRIDSARLDEARTAAPGLSSRSTKDEELAAYLACREIAEHGGIYLAREVQPVNALYPLLFDTASFARRTPTSFSTDFFCGEPGCEAFVRIVDLADRNLEACGQLRLADAIAQVLVCDYGVHLESGGAYGRCGIRIYASSWLYGTRTDGPPLLSYRYRRIALPDGNDAVAIPEDVLSALDEEAADDFESARAGWKEDKRLLKARLETTKAERDSARRQRDAAKRQRDAAKRERDAAKRDLDARKAGIAKRVLAKAKRAMKRISAR